MEYYAQRRQMLNLTEEGEGPIPVPLAVLDEPLAVLQQWVTSSSIRPFPTAAVYFFATVRDWVYYHYEYA